jgi:ADP-ribose pyrophosphatase
MASIRYIDTMPSKKKSAQAKAHSKSVQVLKSRTTYRSPVFHVTSEIVTEPTGVTARRDLVRHPGSVVVLAVDDTGPEPKILLERQFRYAAGKFLWELPAGSMDPNESALEGAKRELLEETGYSARHWKLALFYYPSPGFLTETMSVFLAQDLQHGKANPEADEVIKTRMFPLSAALKMVSTGRIVDGKTISGVLWLAQVVHSA